DGTRSSPAACSPGTFQGAYLKPHCLARLTIMAARGNAQADLIRLGPVWQLAMQAGHADIIDPDFGIREPAQGKALAHNLFGHARPSQCMRSGITDLAFANPAIVIADHHLVAG